METILAILAGLAIVALLKLTNPGHGTHYDAENADLSDFFPVDDNQVHEILKAAYFDLEKQRARGYGPWLSTLLNGPGALILAHDEKGRPVVKKEGVWVEPDIALQAVQMTIDDLDGRGYSLDALYRAKSELEEMMGRGA